MRMPDRQVVTHGSSHLTVVDASAAHRIAFSSVLPMPLSPPNHTIIPAFAVECAAFISASSSSSSSSSSTASSNHGGRLLVLLSSVRIVRQQSAAAANEAQPHLSALAAHSSAAAAEASAAAMGDESNSAAALGLHPIVFENGAWAASIYGYCTNTPKFVS